MTVVKIAPRRNRSLGGALIAVVLLGGAVLFGAFTAAFTVQETESAVVNQFGRPVREIKDAGLYFKIPFVQEVRRFDSRIKAWDGEPNEIPTQGGEFIWVDTTARWRIVEPQRFMESVRDDQSARSRLSDVIDSVVRDQIAGTVLVEIVRSSDWGRPTAGQPAVKVAPTTPKPDDAPDGEEAAGVPGPTDAELAQARQEAAALEEKVEMGRQELTRRILDKSRVVVTDYGIELVDVQIKRINYVNSVQEQVYKRMISDQQRRAEEFRSEGQGESARILGEARRELATIRSTAERQAQIIRGEADAEATRLYNDAYAKDAEFYALWRTLDSYRATVDQRNTLMLGTDSEYYRYLRGVGR